MAVMMRVPRSRGALTGVLLVLLGAWGGLIPFIGPDFRYAYTPDAAWSWTSGRLWLEVLPGVAVLLGGLMVLASQTRPAAVLGAWLAALGGAWFGVGSVVSVLWMNSGAGTPVGGTVARVAEQLGFFTGLSVVTVFLAALALGRFTVIGVRDVRHAERRQAARVAPEPVPAAAAEPDEASPEDSPEDSAAGSAGASDKVTADS